MRQVTIQRRLAAEALGTGLLLAAVVGSGIMAQRLTRDVALALLANSLATGAVLVVLISVLSPVSGAHFNPVVSFMAFMEGQFTVRLFALYSASQIVGGLIGVAAAHAMFARETWQPV